MTNRTRRPSAGRRRAGLPPGPNEAPIIGQTLRYLRGPIELMQEAAGYGDLVTMSVKPWLVYLVNHPDLVKDVLVTNHASVGRWRNVEAFKYLMGEGLVTSDDPLHLRQRRMMQPQFHRQMIEGYSTIMTEYSARHSDGWRDGAEVDMEREMRELSLNIVVKTLFSIDLPDDVQRIGAAFELSNKYISARFNQFERFRDILHRLPLPLTWSFKRQLAYLDGLVFGLIQQRRQSDDHYGDLLSLMIDAEGDRRQSGPEGAQMTDKQVRDETVTMFAVGHDTVTTALTWTWYLLATHPDVQRRFHAELDDVLQGRPPSLDDLPDLEFTEQIIRESMRLYPPIWRTGRLASEPFELGGYTIPKGAVLCIAPVITHRDPRWFDHPMEYLPERWTEEFRQELHGFAYYPFGGGPRLCIGEGFAWMETKLVMATLGQRWRVHRDPTNKAALMPLVSLRPRNGMQLSLERR